MWSCNPGCDRCNFYFLEPDLDKVAFISRSGPLYVERHDDGLQMDFPVEKLSPCSGPKALLVGISVSPQVVYCGQDYMFVLKDESEVINLQPGFRLLATLDRRGVIVTAPGQQVDFVSRYFCARRWY